MRSGELAAVSRHFNLWSLKTGRFLPGHNSTYRDIYWQYSLLMRAHDFPIVKSTWVLGTSMLATIFFAKHWMGRWTSDDGFRSGCQNVSQHQQQSFSGLHYNLGNHSNHNIDSPGFKPFTVIRWTSERRLGKRIAEND